MVCLAGKESKMSRSHPPYPPEFRQQMVELVRAGRTPNELAREFGLTAQSIRNWVNQAEVEEGQRSDGMAMVRHRKPVGRVDISKSEAIADLVLEVAQFFFRLRAVGQKAGLF